MTAEMSSTRNRHADALCPTDHGQWAIGLRRGNATGLILATLSSYDFVVTQIQMGARTIYRSPAKPEPITSFERVSVDETLSIEIGTLTTELGLSSSVVTDIELLSDRVPTMTYGEETLYIWPADDWFIGMRSSSDRQTAYETRAAAIYGLIFDCCYPDRHEKRAVTRTRISAPERRLFEELRAVWPDVVSQARLPFLGSQHIDIWIPSLGIALEYQGPGHTSPIYGEAQLELQQERDARKRRLCAEAGVPLIEVFPGYELSDVIERCAGSPC